MKKLLAVFLVIVMLTGALGLSAVAAGGELTASLHIVGIDETIYYNDALSVTYEGDFITVSEFLEAVSGKDGVPDITIEDGQYGAYVSEIAGLREMEYGAMSGWNYRVNAEEPPIGMSGFVLKDGFDVVLYYGDPFGAGMQYPIVGTFESSEKYAVVFFSEDTVYDENWNASIETNPIVGATITWDGKEYKTDDEGMIDVPELSSWAGFHTLQIERYDEETGVPTVLRCVPDFEVFIPFTDMAAGAWYTDAVKYSVYGGFFKGVGNNAFSPDKEMTMAELVTVLARIAGADTTPEEGQPWYSAAYNWAVDEGIIHNEGLTPDAFVTREIFIYMFYKTAELIGDYDMIPRADITAAADYDSVGEYYLDAVAWAVAAGIITGTGNDGLVISPSLEVSRAQVCQMLLNYYS